MRTICIINHKGGVGKTTTAVNLAAGLTRKDRKVLLIDFDPQGNIALSLRVKSEYDLYDAMIGRCSVQNCIKNLAQNFDVIISNETLAKAEFYLSKNENARMLLKQLLSEIKGYDYIIVDCPPSLGLVNQNVLSFCKEAFVPTSTDFLGYDALRKMTKIIEKINEAYNHNIQITRIIPTLFDVRNKICKDTLSEMVNEFPSVTGYPIRYNSKLKEAPKHGKSIFNHAKSSPGAKDYGRLVEDVIAMEGGLQAQEAEIAAK